MKPQRARLALVGVAVFVVGLGCRPGSSPGNPRLSTLPLIEDDPPLLLQEADLFDERDATRWDFTDPSVLSTWTLVDLQQIPSQVAACRLRVSGDDPHLERTVSLSADTIQAVDLHLAVPVSGGQVELSWATAQGHRSDPSRITLSTEDSVDDGATYRFAVAANRAWRGQVGWLRLDLPGGPGFELELVGVRCVRRQANENKLAAAVHSGLKADLGADVRSAWIGFPDLPVERRVELVGTERLRFSYGLQPGADSPVELVVSAVTEARERVLWRRRLSHRDAGRWHDEEVDLGRLAGSLMLRFEARWEVPPDLARGFPLWSNPEVLAPSEPGGVEPPNVIILLLDTLRADRLSCYGHATQTSPRIDAWASSDAVLFRQAVVQAPWTLPSHVSIFSGLDPLRHGVNHHVRVPLSLELLAETLRRAGYATGAVTGGGYLRPQFGFAQGFDRFVYWSHPTPEDELEHGVEAAVDWLTANHNRRLFLFFHTYETHYPYLQREPFFTHIRGDGAESLRDVAFDLRDRGFTADLTWGGDVLAARRPGSDGWSQELTTDEQQVVRQRYDSTVAYADQQVGRLLDALQALGLRGHTLVVLTSDHGEALGEGGLYGHNYLAEHNLMVPLIVELPDRLGAGRVVDRQVRSVDLAPTILEAASLTPLTELDGRSLLPLIRGDSPEWPTDAWSYSGSSNFGLVLRRDGTLKYAFNDTGWSVLLGREALFDLSGNAPEQIDLAPGVSTDALRREAQQHLASLHRGLRLRLQNRERTALRGELSGSWADHARVKSTGTGCSCVAWGKPARFLLEPGHEQTLLFQNLLPGPLVVEGLLEAGAGRPARPFRETFHREALGRPQALVLEGDTWTRRESSAVEEATGLVLWVEGEADETTSAAPHDREVLDQLRALGYTEP